MARETLGRLAILALVPVAALSLFSPAFAEESRQAGLVIVFGDGRVETRCIAFEGYETRGDDLLARSGLRTVVDASSGMGITVCQIEGQGCAYPAERCFCQCTGGEGCAYWNYFYRDPGGAAWTYSPLGAVLRKVQPGSVEAWVWGDGHAPPSDDLTFEVICAPLPRTTTLIDPGPSPVAPSATPAGESVPTPFSSATLASPQPTHSIVPTTTPPPAASSPSNLSAYWPFGLVVLGLAVIGAIVWARRG